MRQGKACPDERDARGFAWQSLGESNPSLQVENLAS
jgi:hypothetical protein